MKLSTKGEYASRAMLELSARYGQGPVPIRVIAIAQAIPRQFLEQILLSLRRAGQVKSKKARMAGIICPGLLKQLPWQKSSGSWTAHWPHQLCQCP